MKFVLLISVAPFVLLCGFLFVCGEIVRRRGFYDAPLPEKPYAYTDVPEYYDEGKS